MIDFNDLIPSTSKTGLLDFNDLIPTATEEPEPTVEDLESYRRMGLKQYTSPSGKIYPLGFIFDPESTGYDYETAKRYGLKPDETGHWPSRVPETGMILKGRKHPTWNKTVEGEKKLGNLIRRNRDGRYYSDNIAEGKVYQTPTEGLRTQEVPSTILAEPLTQIDIAEQQELEQKNALYKYMRENPEAIRNIQRQNENKVIQDYFTDLPKPRTPYAARERQSRSALALEGPDDSYWRKTYLAKAKRAQIRKLKEQGLIPDKRREYKGFWDELGRNTVGGGLNVASGLTGTLASISEGAIWDPDKLEQWAQKLHKKSKKPTYSAAKKGGWKGFVAASIGQAFPYMAASTASVLITGQPYAAFGIGFSVEGDNAYRDALEAGATEEQAQMNRLVVGTINGAIEQIQVNQVLRFARAGKGSVREVSRLARQKAMKKIAQKGGKLTLDAFQHSAREALEEALQETTSIAAEARINPEAWNNATDRILRSAAGGAVVGLGFGTAGRVLGRRAAPQRPTEALAKPEAVEVPPAEEVREPTEHLVALPKAKGAREIEPAKGETILIENPEQKGDYQKYEDFGTGILRKGNKLYHKASLMQIEKFSTVKNARKAAQTLAQEDIDFELEDVEKIRTQFQQWRTEKGDIDIEAYLIGKGKELQGEDYPEIIRTMAWVREKDTIIKKLKDIVSEVPEFVLNPVLTYKEGYLVFSDGYRFKFMPDYFGINKESLVEGDKIRFDIETLGIKKPSAKKLKAAEIWTGEPKIMGRVAEKPIPVERIGREVKPRKLTAKEETYERALTDIETGKEVEVEGGVTYKAVREDDIRRVAELGRKAGRQAWTVERDILGRQERGTAETKLDIGDAIKIIRDVFSAKPAPTVAKGEKIIHTIRKSTPEEIAEDEAFWESFPDIKKGLQRVAERVPSLEALQDTLKKRIDLLKKVQLGVLTQKEADALTKKFIKAAKLRIESKAEAKPPTVVAKDPDKYREDLIKKWGEDKFDKVWFELAEGGENERFSDIDARVGELDEAGKWNDPETKRLRIEMDSIVDAELEKREAKAKPKEPTEEPSEFIPPAKPKLSFDDLIPDVKHIKNVVVDTFREWPKGIKKVGKDYWTEVMAVAKQLATPYRYRALRQTMLGVFRHKKRPVPEVVGIEVQDVTDVLTATHELAHNIDWLLNNKIFPSSIKARFPSATVGEMSLRNELKKISKIMRPDMWERPKAYIKSHVELMADYISHYILDPEKTKELAPNLTRAFEAKLAAKPELFETISRLQESRYTGPEEPPIAKHIREVFPLPKEFTPLKLAVDMTKDSYVKAAEELGITAVRHYKLLIQRAQKEADRIDELVPNKERQTDLVVLAETGSKNPWTGKTRQEILREGLTNAERKAIKLFRAYQEKARQTVNKYLRGADIAEYIKFIEDYFIHAYQTPLTEKYKTAIARWAKRSPQAKKRILPDLAKSVEIGLKPRAKTLSEGLKLWAGINYRVMTNKAFLRVLPQITNDDGVSILQKPQDYPSWPTVDYWPIRQNYAVPLPGRGILLFQGRVAVDPQVKPFIDAMFGRKVFNTPVRIIEGLNATWKAFQLTLFSFFHHQAEFFSACGSLGPRALPFVGGYYGKRARVFGKKRLFGFLPIYVTPIRTGILKAGKELEQCPEFMEDYLAHGGQRGYISTEGINLMERSLKRAADYLENIIQYKPTTPLTGVYAAAYVHVKAAQEAYSFHQSVLWDNVNRAKLVSYYQIVADGAKNSNLPIKDVKEIAVKYINDNFGGQEWLNTMFRNRKTRQFWTQLMMSLDWTWSQIKTARWPFGIGEKGKERRAFVRKIGRHHWFWYLSAIAGFTLAGSFAMSGKGPWENEMGHKLDIDWTKIWRSLPWNRDWKERGDYARRYTVLGKAGRELVRWVTSPLRAFGYKLSPVARSMFEQTTGYNVGSDWAEPWAREDLQLYQEVYARFKHLMENFKPFAFSGNNAFLALPSRKGMTSWKATRTYEDIYKARAIIAMGGIGGKIAKANQILKKDENKLRVEIEHACKLNNVDMEKADRAALAGVRSKYYRLFWKATEMPEKKAVKLCNDYANALLELGVTPKGFKQSLRYRSQELPEKSKELGVQLFHDAAANE